MQKKLLTGVLLGIAVGAVYHYTHKDKPESEDPLYRATEKAESVLKTKLDEAKDPNSDLHANIAKAADKARDVAEQTTSQVKEKAKDTADKLRGNGENMSDLKTKLENAADTAKTKIDNAVDRAEAKKDANDTRAEAREDAREGTV